MSVAGRTATVTILAVALLVAVLWWRRPREVVATGWAESDDGWGTFV